MAGRTVRLDVEWALWGKEPGDHDYRVLACSQSGLTEQKFDQILNRFSIGTPDTLPQVTIVWSGREDGEERIGIAIHESSATPDKVGRRIAVTRYFCVRYEQLAYQPVSYLALYRRLRTLRLPQQGELRIDVDRMRPDEIASSVNEQVMSTAALLLTDKSVCIVCDDKVGLDERLLFLDTVAAMLPYGMRSKLSASTWTSSTAQHNIRLSFTADARDEAHNVFWGRPTPISSEAQTSQEYMRLLLNHADRKSLIARLAQATDLMGFGPRQSRLPLAVLDQSYREPAHGVDALRETDRPEKVVRSLADALQRQDVDAAKSFIGRLKYLSHDLGVQGRRDELKQILKEELLLSPRPWLEGDYVEEMYGSLLRLTFGRSLSKRTLNEVHGIVHGVFSPLLLDALARMHTYDPVASVSIARRRSSEALQKVLTGYSGAELVHAAAGLDADESFIDTVCKELARRYKSQEGMDSGLAEALERSGFLGGVLETCYPGQYKRQFELMLSLLKVAYGEGALGDQELESALNGTKTMPSRALLSAVAYLYGSGAGDALTDRFLRKKVEEFDLTTTTRDVIRKNMALRRPKPAPTGGHPVLAPRQDTWQQRADLVRHERSETGWWRRTAGWWKRQMDYLLYLLLSASLVLLIVMIIIFAMEQTP